MRRRKHDLSTAKGRIASRIVSEREFQQMWRRAEMEAYPWVRTRARFNLGCRVLASAVSLVVLVASAWGLFRLGRFLCAPYLGVCSGALPMLAVMVLWAVVLWSVIHLNERLEVWLRRRPF